MEGLHAGLQLAKVYLIVRFDGKTSRSEQTRVSSNMVLLYTYDEILQGQDDRGKWVCLFSCSGLLI